MKQNHVQFLFAIFTFVVGLLYLPSQAMAEPFVNFPCDEPSSLNGEAFYQPAAWSCETANKWGVGVSATALVLNVGAMGAACTVVGAPATLWLEGGSIALEGVSIVIGQLPCDNAASEQRIRELAEEAVCKKLAAMGVSCALQPTN